MGTSLGPRYNILYGYMKPLGCFCASSLKTQRMLRCHRCQRASCSSFNPSAFPLRVQVPNNYVLTQNLYHNYYYPQPQYQIVGYLDPLGSAFRGIGGKIDLWLGRPMGCLIFALMVLLGALPRGSKYPIMKALFKGIYRGI